MPTLSQIFGGLIIVAALVLAGHEVWRYNHPDDHALPSTQRRLRRRLNVSLIIIAIVGMLTWAGRLDTPVFQLTLYGLCFLGVVSLLALAYADMRETANQILREHLDMGPQALGDLADDPEVKRLIEKLQRGELDTEALEALRQRLEHPPSDSETS